MVAVPGVEDHDHLYISRRIYRLPSIVDMSRIGEILSLHSATLQALADPDLFGIITWLCKVDVDDNDGR
jgi:hypothetical protein